MKFQLIIDSLEKIRKTDIKIEPGACIDWVHDIWPNHYFNGHPRAVNWSGAVLFVNGNNYSFQTLLKLLEMSKVDFYMFTIGFDQGTIISILDEKMKEIGKDRISLFAYELRKKYLK